MNIADVLYVYVFIAGFLFTFMAIGAIHAGNRLHVKHPLKQLVITMVALVFGLGASALWPLLILYIHHHQTAKG